MSNPNIQDSNLRVNLENIVLKGNRVLNTEQDFHNRESKRGRDETMPETAIVEVSRKVLIEREFVKDAHKNLKINYL